MSMEDVSSALAKSGRNAARGDSPHKCMIRRCLCLTGVVVRTAANHASDHESRHEKGACPEWQPRLCTRRPHFSGNSAKAQRPEQLQTLETTSRCGFSEQALWLYPQILRNSQVCLKQLDSLTSAPLPAVPRYTRHIPIEPTTLKSPARDGLEWPKLCWQAGCSFGIRGPDASRPRAT